MFTILSKMELLGLPLLQQGGQVKLKTRGSFMGQYWGSRFKIQKPKNPPRAPCLTLRTARNHLWKPRAGRTKPKAQRYSQAWAAQVENVTLCTALHPGCPQQWGSPSLSHCTGEGRAALGFGSGGGTGHCATPGKPSAWGRGGLAGSLHVGITMELCCLKRGPSGG